MGLPVTLEQVGLSEADIPALCEYAHATNEWKQGNPEPFTDEKFAAAIKAANAYGHSILGLTDQNRHKGDNTFVAVFYCRNMLESNSLAGITR